MPRVRLEPAIATTRSRVKHSTTEPLGTTHLALEIEHAQSHSWNSIEYIIEVGLDCMLHV